VTVASLSVGLGLPTHGVAPNARIRAFDVESINWSVSIASKYSFVVVVGMTSPFYDQISIRKRFLHTENMKQFIHIASSPPILANCGIVSKLQAQVLTRR